jgi:hypothetical protein
MQADSDAIFQAALSLPEAERLALVSRLIETMPEHSLTACLDDDDLRSEVERRFADQAGSVPWTELRDEG